MKRSYFPENGVWLKGNPHSHSTVSDGAISPADLENRYIQAGYDFLSMTDHNLFVPHREVSPELLLLPTGVEHDIEYSPYKCIHVVGLGKAGKEATDYPCRKYRPGEISQQQLLNRMREDGQFVSVAHPIWSRMDPEELSTLEGFHAIEVFNNGTHRLCRGGDAEAYWDLLLQRGRKVFATAVDDVHGGKDLFGGWIWVKASERSVEAVMEALFRGEFYASRGPVIHDFGTDGNTVYVSCSDCREIHFVSYPRKGRSFFAAGDSSLTEAFHTLREDVAYVRAVCVDREGRAAWTNPTFFDERKER